MRWPWQTDHSASGVSMSREVAEKALPMVTGARRRLRDCGYVSLGPEAVAAMVYDYHDRNIVFRREFPDCDDFAKLAVADILRRCYLAGWSRAPAFGLAVVEGSKRPHMLNIALHPGGAASLYEPQTGCWLEFGDFKILEVEL